MFYLFDTCALNHIRELQENKIIDLRNIILQFRIGITNAIVKEWENYGLVHFFSPENCYLIPIQNHDIDGMIARFPFFNDFDEADQTLLWASMQDSSVIISDDGGLNAAALSVGKKAIFLPDLLIYLVKEGFLNKNEVRKALKFWKEVHRYNKSSHKRWLKSLNLII